MNSLEIRFPMMPRAKCLENLAFHILTPRGFRIQTQLIGFGSFAILCGGSDSSERDYAGAAVLPTVLIHV